MANLFSGNSQHMYLATRMHQSKDGQKLEFWDDDQMDESEHIFYPEMFRTLIK